ncbi:MAG: hypothetical protein NC923_00085 [Candidatus Omnitrophica bacterium]|nr:hypothetical protein [Candidatus Omnitrophota bacterium]
MRLRRSYIILGVFIFLISIIFLINIWLNHQIEEKFNPEKKEITEQETITGISDISLEQSFPSKVTPKPAITVVKRPQKEKTELDLEERRTQIKSSSLAPQQSPVSGRLDDSALNDESAPGAAKINKRPSEIEIKEMNEKGIVIW